MIRGCGALTASNIKFGKEYWFALQKITFFEKEYFSDAKFHVDYVYAAVKKGTISCSDEVVDFLGP